MRPDFQIACKVHLSFVSCPVPPITNLITSRLANYSNRKSWWRLPNRTWLLYSQFLQSDVEIKLTVSFHIPSSSLLTAIALSVLLGRDRIVKQAKKRHGDDDSRRSFSGCGVTLCYGKTPTSRRTMLPTCSGWWLHSRLGSSEMITIITKRGQAYHLQWTNILLKCTDTGLEKNTWSAHNKGSTKD